MWWSCVSLSLFINGCHCFLSSLVAFFVFFLCGWWSIDRNALLFVWYLYLFVCLTFLTWIPGQRRSHRRRKRRSLPFTRRHFSRVLSATARNWWKHFLKWLVFMRHRRYFSTKLMLWWDKEAKWDCSFCGCFVGFVCLYSFGLFVLFLVGWWSFSRIARRLSLLTLM